MVMGSSAAHAAATAVLPTPVGPTITGVRGGISGSPKSPLQLALGQLYDRGPAVHVVGRQCRAEQAEHELPHLLHLEPLTRLDGRATGEGRREALQPVGERAESPSGEIGDELLEAARRVEWGVGAVCTTTLRPENGSTSNPTRRSSSRCASTASSSAPENSSVSGSSSRCAGAPSPVSWCITRSYSTRSCAECWSTIATPESDWKMIYVSKT